MDRRKQGVVALLCVAACTQPDFTTPAGVAVWCDDPAACYTADEIDRYGQIFAEVWGKDLHDWWDGIALVVHPKAFTCPYTEPSGQTIQTTCAGLASGGGVVDLQYFDCIGQTALAHEYGHLRLLTESGDSDYYHQDSRVFPNGCLNGDGKITDDESDCMMQTVEVRAAAQTQKELCGER